MSSGDVFLLTDAQIYVAADPNPILNVYAYRQTSGTGDSEALVTQFITDVLPDIVGVQSVAMGHSMISAVNLDDPTDFFETAVGSEIGTGTQAGDCLPRYNCFSFIYRRTTREVRNGWKRIAGVPESAQVNGVVTNAGFISALAMLAVTLGEPIVGEGADVWNPRILRRENPDHTPAVLRADFAVSVVNFVGLSTQNSRKR